MTAIVPPRLFVGREVFRDVRDHALDQPPDIESGGWIFFDDRGHAIGYQRAVNVSPEPFAFECQGGVEPLFDAPLVVHCHSHPPHPDWRGQPEWLPSAFDIESVRSIDQELMGVYANRYDVLKIWRVLPDGYSEQPAYCERPRRHRRR